MAKKRHRFPKEETPRVPTLSICDLVVNRRSLWGSSKPLLNQLSFSADKGEIVALSRARDSLLCGARCQAAAMPF